MACRLFNRSGELLRIDLRGGETLQLAPGATSQPLREELLYENLFLPQWERAGLVLRLPARFADIQEMEKQAAAAASAAAAPGATRKGAKKSAAEKGATEKPAAEKAATGAVPRKKST